MVLKQNGFLGALEVIADDLTRQVKAGLAAGPAVLHPQVAAGR